MLKQRFGLVFDHIFFLESVVFRSIDTCYMGRFSIDFTCPFWEFGHPQEEAKEVQKAIVSLGPQVHKFHWGMSWWWVCLKTRYHRYHRYHRYSPKWPWVKIDVYHLPMKMASWEVFSVSQLFHAFPISQLNNAKPNWPLHAFPKRRSLFHWSSQVRVTKWHCSWPADQIQMETWFLVMKVIWNSS